MSRHQEKRVGQEGGGQPGGQPPNRVRRRGVTADAVRKCALSLLCAACCVLAACDASCVHRGRRAPTVEEIKKQARSSPAADVARAPYAGPTRLAVLEDPAVEESSGIVASRRNPGLFWTHNDSGDGPYLYAFDRAGRRRGVWRVRGAKSRDWEDIAAGPGPERGRPYLYVGDIGDNERKREEVVVYRVAEPEVTPADEQAGGRDAPQTEAAEAIRLKYPDGRHNAEALLVHPLTGDLYVVTKTTAAAGVYKLAAPFTASAVNTLARVAEVKVPGLFGGLVTGGDISADGRRVVLCDYVNAYELSLPGDSAGSFDSVWGRPPLLIELGEREQGEAVCYGADGGAVYATSEKRPAPLIEARRVNQ